MSPDSIRQQHERLAQAVRLALSFRPVGPLGRRFPKQTLTAASFSTVDRTTPHMCTDSFSQRCRYDATATFRSRFHVKPSQSECSARNKQDLGTHTYCEDLNASAIRARPLLITHRVDQVDAPYHRFTHRSYGKHRQRAHRMQRALSLLVGIHSSFNVGRARAPYSCADCLTHPLPRKSPPARQRLTFRKTVSRETKSSSSTASYSVRDRTDTTAIIRRHSPGEGLRDTLPTNPIVHVQNTAHVPLAAVLHKCAGSCNTIPSLVSRETKAHPFHTGLDRIPASYVSVDTEVGPRHIRPRPHRCIHLR